MNDQDALCRGCGAPARWKLAWSAPEAIRLLGQPKAAGVAGPWCEGCAAGLAEELTGRLRPLVNKLQPSLQDGQLVALVPEPPKHP